MTCSAHGVTLDTCGCCAGGAEEPGHYNAPGLPAISYRLGGHPEFLARMKARIHAWETLSCPLCEARYAGPDRLTLVLEHIARAHPEVANPADLVISHRPLGVLGTRASDDPAIALMDAWAVVGDVITFYQERIANEGYLRTATERRSILALARAIGYELDPGVAAETYLAFSVDDAEGAPLTAEVPAGTQVLSIPAASDEVPQTFETAEDLTAHVGWNALRPRLVHPLTLTSGLSHVYLQGVATGVRAGQTALLIIGNTRTVKRIARVTTDTAAGHTRVDFTSGSASPATTLPSWPAAALDPNQEPLSLTRANVETHVVEKTWQEKDLQAFLTMHGWEPAQVIAYVDDLRASSFQSETQTFLAFREKLGFFGNNAPYFASLPDLPTSDSGSSIAARAIVAEEPSSTTVEDLVSDVATTAAKAWPHNWDSLALSIWKDSVTNLYYRTASEPFDVYLERAVPDLAGGGWAVFERLPDTSEVYQVADVTEASRAGFGLSAKVSGLQLKRADGSAIGANDTDKPPALHFRLSTAHVKSEAVALAGVPLTEDIAAGTTSIRLGTMVLGLRVGQVVGLQGEELETDGRIRSEMLVLEAISHAAGYTTLQFEQGVTRGYVRASVTITANVVLASHGETVANEVLGSGDGSARHQRFVLGKPPLTHRSAIGGSDSTLEVRVDGVAWQQVDSLYGLEGSARAYVVRIDDDANATVVFGDARSGSTLPTGQENVRATYRSGIGLEGEVGAGSLVLLKTRPFGIRSVTNPLPAAGADDPETLDDARGNAPLTVRTLGRVVSLIDYEDYARAYPGIGKARADAIWDGETEVVHITVADSNGDAVVEPLHGRLLESIEDARDPLRPLVLATYQLFVFFVKASVLIDEAYLWADVEASLQSELKASFGFEARCFAQPVTAAEVLQAMHRVPGVLAVDLDELYRTAPDEEATGSLFNTVLEAQPARYSKESNQILPAELVMIHEFGIDLVQMGE
jgi:hypothetical protein